MSAQARLTGYLSYLGHERRLSPLTCLAYKRDVDALLQSAGKTPLEELRIHQIRRFVATLHARGLGGKSLGRMLSAWRGFFEYLARDHGFVANPCLGLKPPKSPRLLPDALAPDQAARMVEIAGDSDLDIRDRAIFELFYSSGLRLSELVSLTPAAIDMSDATVTITGKGAKTRVVPVGRKAIAALRRWLQVRGKFSVAPDDPLFINRQGKRLGQRAIQHRFKHWGSRQGVGVQVHPHMLRHSFASHLLQSSGDLRAVQELLGHSSITSTQVYTHLDFQHLSKVYDAAHPRAKRKS